MDATGRYRYWRDPELGPGVRAGDGRPVRRLRPRRSRAVEAWAAERFPRSDGEPEAAHRRSIRAKALDLLRGLLPAASLSHMGDVRERPGLRAARHAPARLAAARGALLRRGDPARAEGGHPELRHPRRAARARRRVDRLPGRARVPRPGRWSARLGLDRARGDAAESGPSVRLLSVRGSEDDLLAALLFEASRVVGGGGARRRPRAAARRAGHAARATWSASAPTAATGPAAASRRSPTASRSSPTTAPSATSSATGC